MLELILSIICLLILLSSAIYSLINLDAALLGKLALWYFMVTKSSISSILQTLSSICRFAAIALPSVVMDGVNLFHVFLYSSVMLQWRRSLYSAVFIL